MDLNYVKPFANTSDLVKKTPIIDANEAKKKEELEKEREKEKNSLKKETTIELEPDQEDTENMKAKDPKKKSKS